MSKKKQQSGFTLIELVVVIVILGILAATALPKFVDLSSEAKQAALDGVAGAMGSAMSVNYAGCAAKNQTVTADKCVQVTSCSNVGNVLQGGIPAGYTVTPATAIGANGTTATCTVTQTDGGDTATFVGISAAN